MLRQILQVDGYAARQVIEVPRGAYVISPQKPDEHGHSSLLTVQQGTLYPQAESEYRLGPGTSYTDADFVCPGRIWYVYQSSRRYEDTGRSYYVSICPR